MPSKGKKKEKRKKRKKGKKSLPNRIKSVLSRSTHKAKKKSKGDKGRVEEGLRHKETKESQTKTNQTYPVIALSSETVTQPTQKSSADDDAQQKIGAAKVKKKDAPTMVWCSSPKTEIELDKMADDNKHPPLNAEPNMGASTQSMTGTVSRSDEVSCEVPHTGFNEVESITSSVPTAPDLPSSTASSSGQTTVVEINDVIKEISSKIQNITLTSERLETIKKYFSESRPLTTYESDAFDWLTDNIHTVYKNPISACKKLRTAVGNRTVPTDVALKSLRLYVHNRTIRETDVLEHCKFEGRHEITVNELSELLKRLIKMKIKNVLFEDADPVAAVPSLKSVM